MELNYLCSMELFMFRHNGIISSQTLLGMLLLIHAGIKVNQEVGAPTGRFCISFLRNIPCTQRFSDACNTHTGTKSLTYCRRHFQMHFLHEKYVFIQISFELSLKDNQTLVPKVVICHYMNQCWTDSLQYCITGPSLILWYCKIVNIADANYVAYFRTICL